MAASFNKVYGKTWDGFDFDGLKPAKMRYVPIKNRARDFQNSPPLKRSACFCVTIAWDFERFQYLNFQTSFLKK